MRIGCEQPSTNGRWVTECAVQFLGFFLSRLLTVEHTYIDLHICMSPNQTQVAQLWKQVCSSLGTNHMVYYQPVGHVQLIDQTLVCGLVTSSSCSVAPDVSSKSRSLVVLNTLRGSMESLLTVLDAGWMPILVGPPGCGKFPSLIIWFITWDSAM